MTESDKPRRKVFALPERVGNPTSSVEFQVGDETFRCRPTMSSIRILEFADLIGHMPEEGSEDKADPKELAKVAGSIIGLLRNVIIDYDRFRKFADENDLDLDMLGEIAGWIVEAYTGRPTQ